MGRLTLTDLIEDYLLLWILLSVGLGIALPRLVVVTRASTLILAVMIGSISLTLSVERFRGIDTRTLGLVLLGHVMMPFLAFGITRELGLSPELTVGFVVLGAVTPELVTPVMTELAGGDTALSTTALVVIGVGSVGFIPIVVALLAGGINVPTLPIVEQLVVAVVVPMLVAVGARAWQPDRVSRYDAYYSAGREYGEKESWDSKRFRVVGVRDEDADDGYRLYITTLPAAKFNATQVATVYRARWVVELVFRELKSRYGLGRFQTEKEHIVRIQVLAALLTLGVNRAILRVFVDHAEEIGDDCVFPTECWATTFRSYAQRVLSDIVMDYCYSEPNLPET